MAHNNSKWRASLFTVEKHEVREKWKGESLLREIIEVNQ